ncbi:hypothetical protein BTA51_14785 [Hahella sp. CCB-MM4]|uniref:MipA/OmpV family protein n=1 Tax=Hahella sp. (strain CCB-MM4) TaxID=1926491 RepID=UPI000B9A9889|nr:MipA/OmpV family protein [Hahella sp. CCB-MM4]OZG72783.1 hypothetical protein BTA51_14785 [Hahella sp. CCB-MM4]
MKTAVDLNFSPSNFYLPALLLGQLLVAAKASAISPEQVRTKITTISPDTVLTKTRELSVTEDRIDNVEVKSEGQPFDAVVTQSGELTSVQEDIGQPWIVGFGVKYDSGIYKDQSSGIKPIPLISAEIGNFWMQGLTFGYYAYQSNLLQVSPLLQISPGQGYDQESIENNSRLYDGLEDRKLAVDAGFQLDYNLSWVDISSTLLTDVSNSHSGLSAELRLGRDFNLSDTVILAPSISAHYHSSDFNQYYYGVDEEFGTAFRPAYDVGAGVEYSVGVTTIWQFTRSWSVMGQVSHTILNGAVEDSPLVDKGQETSLILGIGYAF